MPIVYVDGVEESHMRFVFTDAVVSLPLADDATFQDVALTCRDLTRRNLGALVSIVVALKPNEAKLTDSMTTLPSPDPEPGSEVPGFAGQAGALGAGGDSLGE